MLNLNSASERRPPLLRRLLHVQPNPHRLLRRPSHHLPIRLVRPRHLPSTVRYKPRTRVPLQIPPPLLIRTPQLLLSQSQVQTHACFPLCSFRHRHHPVSPAISATLSDPSDLHRFQLHEGVFNTPDTMSEVFEGYERQYCELSANLSRKCTSAGALEGEQKKQKLSEIKGGIDEAESLIRRMDLDARSLQPSVKAVLLAKLREYKSDLNNLKNEVKRITFGNLNAAARDELLESGLADTLTASADQRSRLMTTTERLGKTSDRIKDSRRTMLETEDLGVSILEDLHSQRQSLLRAHDTLHGVDDNIGRSKRILTNMSRRMNKNKWTIGCIVSVLVIAIVVILYFKLK